MRVWAELPNGAPLRLLSVVIPAHNEQGCICSTVEHLHLELRLHNVPHEIVAVDDGSTDSTWQKPGGNTPGVGYWASDINTLYVCNPTNTWTVYYTPFTYPHPLVSDPVVMLTPRIIDFGTINPGSSSGNSNVVLTNNGIAGPSSPDTVLLSCNGLVPSTPPISSNPIISAVPLPGPPILSSVSRTKTYVTKNGCSQDGAKWLNPCTFRVFCSNCNAATILSLDGTVVAQTFTGSEMDATVPLTILPVPSTVTAHSFFEMNPVPTLN
jgi:hypothetical protein